MLLFLNRLKSNLHPGNCEAIWSVYAAKLTGRTFRNGTEPSNAKIQMPKSKSPNIPNTKFQPKKVERAALFVDFRFLFQSPIIYLSMRRPPDRLQRNNVTLATM
jgi:hypothetical protein